MSAMQKNASPALRIYLEDHGQDRGQELLVFTVKDRVISHANIPGFIWDGAEITNTNIKPGDLIRLKDGYFLKYPVQTVSLAEEG